LDVKGLSALWREALLAQQVLAGHTVGYTHHPQLIRFKAHAQPATAIAYYLSEIWTEADRRGYRFKKEKIAASSFGTLIKLPVTRGQLQYEFSWLLHKLQTRDPARGQLLRATRHPELHPLFALVEGPLAGWEKPVPALTGNAD